MTFFPLENVLSPEGRCLAYPVGVQLRLFPFIEFWVRKGILDFKNQYGLSTFFCLKMFYLMGWTGGTCGTVHQKGPLIFLFSNTHIEYYFHIYIKLKDPFDGPSDLSLRTIKHCQREKGHCCSRILYVP